MCMLVEKGYRPADTTPGLTTHRHVQYQSPAPCRVEYGPFARIPARVQPSQGMPLPNPSPEASAPTLQRRNREIESRYALRSALAHSRSRAPLREGA